MESHESDEPELSVALFAAHLMEHDSAKVFEWLRVNRHRLFRPEDHQGLYKNAKRGRTNIAPEFLSCVLFLEYLCGVSDVEAVNRVRYDLRWKHVLGLPGDAEAPFERSTLVRYRARLLEGEKVDVVFRRSVQMAAEDGILGKDEAKRLAVDSTAIFGAGAVRDTYQLIGDGILKVLRREAGRRGASVEKVVEELGLDLDPQRSIKGWLDIEWTDPTASREALNELLELTRELRSKVSAASDEDEWSFIDRIIEQDVEDDPVDEGSRIRRGVAPDRVISSSDPDMRHGRKSHSRTFDGYKGHVAVTGDSGIIAAVAVQPANAPEAQPLPDLLADSEDLLKTGVERLHTDTAYAVPATFDTLADSHPDTEYVVKPRRLSNGGRFVKTDFHLDLPTARVTCPAGKAADIHVRHRESRPNAPLGDGTGGSAHFNGKDCSQCWLSQDCRRPDARQGRSVAIHPYEQAWQRARSDITNPEGREKLRQRVIVEHVLARMTARGMRKARYRGINKVRLQTLWIAAAVNIRRVMTG